jgi:uncharacterized protein DUF3224
MEATASFVLDTFAPEPPYAEDGGITYSRAHIDKTFRGEVEGHSTVEMLSVQGDGSGYVGLERFEVRVRGRAGTFAMLHCATMEGEQRWATWPIVPGSGTGELEGIHGEGEIIIAPDGSHTLVLRYQLPATFIA